VFTVTPTASQSTDKSTSNDPELVAKKEVTTEVKSSPPEQPDDLPLKKFVFLFRGTLVS
jgi:hypothetical protein